MKFFKIFGIISLLIFSFYLTDEVTLLAINLNPLMEEIKNNKNMYCIESVDATIDKNTIIPGIKGKKINEIESYLNMKDFGSFNANYLIYDFYNPDISIENNKEKIIISGNKTLRQVSILLYDNDSLLDYSKNNNINSTKLVKYNDKLNYNELINIESSEDLFRDLNTILNKNNLNKKICILNYSNIKVCKEKEYYIVNPNIKINNTNILNTLKDISNGDIILVDKNLTIDNFKLLINKINNNDLKIVYLSKIIEE